MDLKVVRIGGRLVLEIPAELKLKEGQELELIEVKPGLWTLIAQEAFAPTKAETEKAVLPDDEIAVLKKLEGIAYAERIPASVNRMLSPVERRALDSLMRKGFVRIYTGGKYAKTGVYDMTREAYRLAREAAAASNVPERTTEKENLPWDEHLHKYGYVIVESEAEAKAISTQLEKSIKEKEILGTRGFDKKFYIAERRFYQTWSEKIKPILRGRACTVDEVCSMLGMSDVACKVALELMRDQGEIIEKKKGLYTVA